MTKECEGDTILLHVLDVKDGLKRMMKNLFYKSIIVLFCCMVLLSPCLVQAQGQDKLAGTQFRFVKVRPGELTKRNINWEKVPGADGYELYIADSKDGAYRVLTDIKNGNIEN